MVLPSRKTTGSVKREEPIKKYEPQNFSDVQLFRCLEFDSTCCKLQVNFTAIAKS
jgi:hypothetical protein